MSARGAATRSRLLAAAVELIPELGWGAVSTRAVAERAGVNPALVHYHFPTVADLLTTAALDFCRAFGGTWLDLTDGTDGADGADGADAADAADGLRRLITQLDAHPADAPASRLMSEIILAAPRHPDLRTGLADLVADLRARLADRLRAGGAADPEGTAALALAAVEGIALHRAIGAAVDTAVYARAIARAL